MSTTNGTMPRLEQLDTVFALSVDPSAVPPPSGPPPSDTAHWALAAEVRAEREWLDEERQRLDEFTQAQFQAIQKQREELAVQRATIDQELIKQHQDLHRQMKVLQARNEALDARERHLNDREAMSPAHRERIQQAEQQLQHLQDLNSQLRQDNDAQKLLQGQLKAEVLKVREELRIARAEQGRVDQGLNERKRVLDEQQAKLTAQRQLLEARLLELQRGEEDLERRMSQLAGSAPASGVA